VSRSALEEAQRQCHLMLLVAEAAFRPPVIVDDR
jgi:hypothetical protein